MIKRQSQSLFKAILCAAVLVAPIRTAASPSKETVRKNRPVATSASPAEDASVAEKSPEGDGGLRSAAKRVVQRFGEKRFTKKTPEGGASPLVFAERIYLDAPRFPEDAPLKAAEWAKNTVKIFRFNDSGRTEAQGSGFFVQNPSGGAPLLVTACHVLKPSLFQPVDTNFAETRAAFFDSRGYRLKVKRVRVCSTKEDVAVLETEGFAGEGFRLADRLQSGEPVYILGYPRGASEIYSKIYKTMSLTEGLMLFHERAKPQFGIAPGGDDFQRDLSGSSGGPVLNGKGEAAGVYQTQTGSPVILHGALRANLLADSLKQEEDIREGRRIREVLGKMHFFRKLWNFPPSYLQGDNLILVQKAAASGEPGAVLLISRLEKTARLDAVTAGTGAVGAVAAGSTYYWALELESAYQAALAAANGLDWTAHDWTVPSISTWLLGAASGFFIGVGAVSCRRAFQTFKGLKKAGDARRESLSDR